MEDNKKKLSKNFFFNFVSQILTLIVPLITTPYLSRVLHETGNGKYSYSVSIITYFILFSNLGFDVYGQRQTALHQDNIEARRKIFWEIFTLKWFFTLISMIVLLSICFTVGFGDSYTNIILILSIQVLAVPFDIQFYYKGMEKFETIALRTIITKIIGLICIFVFVKEESDLWIYALAVSLIAFGSNILMWISLKGMSFVRLRELELKKHLLPVILIFLPTLAVTIYSVFDKTMIGLLAENRDYENGCYEQAYKLNSVMVLFVTIISAVLVSRNANAYSKGETDEIKKNVKFASNYVFFIGIPILVGVFVLASNLSSWFLGEGYAEVPILLKIMSVRLIFSGFGEIYGSQLFIATGKEKYVTISTAIAAVINITLNYFFIKMWGATGAAITTAISECLVTTTLFIFALKYKYTSIKELLKMLWKYLIAVAVMFAGIYTLNNIFDYSIWSFLLITLAGMVIYYVMLLILRDAFVLKVSKYALDIFKTKVLRKDMKKVEVSTEDEKEDDN